MKVEFDFFLFSHTFLSAKVFEEKKRLKLFEIFEIFCLFPDSVLCSYNVLLLFAKGKHCRVISQNNEKDLKMP